MQRHYTREVSRRFSRRQAAPRVLAGLSRARRIANASREHLYAPCAAVFCVDALLVRIPPLHCTQRPLAHKRARSDSDIRRTSSGLHLVVIITPPIGDQQGGPNGRAQGGARGGGQKDADAVVIAKSNRARAAKHECAGVQTHLWQC